MSYQIMSCLVTGYDGLEDGGQDGGEEVVFDGGYHVPAGIYNRLFDYQKTGENHSVYVWAGGCML